MKPFIVKTNSWHYKLHDTFTDGAADDFCSYWRGVVWGMIVLFVLTSVVGTFFGFTGYLIIWPFVFGLIWGMQMESWYFPAVTGLLLVVAAGTWALTKWEQRLRQKRYDRYMGKVPATEPGFVATAYRSWKNKYCMPVKYE